LAIDKRVNKFLPLTNTNHHELDVRKPFLTFKFHKIKKEHEGFPVNIGARVRGVCVVRGKNISVL